VEEPAKAAKQSAAPPRPAEAPKAAARKLSYKQKFALESLPGKMDKLRAEIAATEAKMADPSLYSADPGSFSRLAATLETKRGELEAMEEEWLELEILREELES